MWLGIDLGTSGVKTVIIDDASSVLAEQSVAYSVRRPQPSWSEQDPMEWWAAVQKAIRALPGDLRRSVRGIGLSGQMHGAVLLGKSEQLLRPAILWNDGRSESQSRHLDVIASKHTGNGAMPGFTAPKLLWVQDHEPEIFASLGRVLLPKDFIRLKLTGETCSDMSDASGTLWLDVAGRTWSDPMLSACGLDVSHMPHLAEGSAPTGQLRSTVANSLGLPVVPVAGGAGDQAAGAIGAGVLSPGQGMLSLGTSGVIFAGSDGFAPNPDKGVHAFCHAIPDRWHVMSVMLSAAACLEWATRLSGFPDVRAALKAAQDRPSRVSTPVFLPYLSGERTPHSDPNARGVFFGLDHDTDKAALIDAVAQGVAFALRDCLDALALELSELSVIGGGAQSSYWAQILSDALQMPLVYRDAASHGPALGAARLARLSVTSEPAQAVCTQPPIRDRFEPGEEPTERLSRFRRLYHALRPEFEADL